MSEVIAVASGKGGVGKTTLTANIGIALARMGKKTVVVDTDMGLRNLDLALGLENSVVYDIIDVVSGECRLREAEVSDKKYRDFAFLPATQFKSFDDFTSDKLKKITDKLRETFDYILIDCPAGIGSVFSACAECADRAIIVVNPDPFSLRDADRVAGILEEKGISDIRMIVNRYRENLVSKGVMLDVNNIIDAIAIRLLGVVNEDEAFIESCISGTPVVLNFTSSAALEIVNIARRINGERVPFAMPSKKGFLKRFIIGK